MVQFIDTHVHLQDFNGDCALSVLSDERVQKLVLISTQRKDFVEVAHLIRQYPDKCVGAFGVHPWYSKEEFLEDELKRYLQEFPNALVGEIGVDELREKVSVEQHELFEAQLLIAKEFHRPVIVHAAKAFMPLKEHEKTLKNVKYVHHGFVKNRELLQFINKTGGYIGLGSLFLRQEKAKEMWQMMPKDRVLFETDAPYRIKENEYFDVVEDNLYKLSYISGEDKEKLALKLADNAKAFLKV